MSQDPQRAFSELQIVCALFADRIGDDLYYARQIRDSIRAVLPAGESDSIEAFVTCAAQLAQQQDPDGAAGAIGLVPANGEHSYSLLALRQRLLDALKRTCRFERPLLVLTGLKEAICPAGQRWTAPRKREYQEAIAYARAFCHARSRPSAKLSLLIV